MRKYVARCKANAYTERQQNLIIQFSEGLCKGKPVICVLCTMGLEESCEFIAS